MTIFDAMNLLLWHGPLGAMAKRESWKGCALAYLPGMEVANALPGFDTGATSGRCDLVMVNDAGQHAGWVPCLESLACDDWEVVAITTEDLARAREATAR
jgi:hypothetical protein